MNELTEDTRSFLKEVEAEIGPEKLKPILNRHGGRRHYVPTTKDFYRSQRDAWIRAKFKGDYEEIKRLIKNQFREELSTRQIRRIVD